MKISLRIEKKEVSLLSPKSEERQFLYQGIRLKSLVYFKDRKNSNQPLSAIVDTGAFISVLPSSVWKNIYFKNICEAKVAGLNPEENTFLSCQIGIVEMTITDEKKNFSPTFKSLAYLIDRDDIPLVLGFGRCLEYFRMEIDIPMNYASLSWNRPESQK